MYGNRFQHMGREGTKSFCASRWEFPLRSGREDVLSKRKKTQIQISYEGAKVQKWEKITGKKTKSIEFAVNAQVVCVTAGHMKKSKKQEMTLQLKSYA